MLQVFHVKRMLSSATGQALFEEVNISLKKGIRDVILNFQEVPFMDSMGLNCLLQIKRRVSEVDGKLALCSLHGQAKMLLELSNLDRAFECYDNLDSFCNDSSCRIPAQAEKTF